MTPNPLEILVGGTREKKHGGLVQGKVIVIMRVKNMVRAREK